MIALTQEKREELIQFLNASIEKRCTVYTLAKQRELESLRDEISLSSITAKPFGYVDEDAVKDRDRLFSVQVFADEEDLPSYEFSELSYPLYLSPPVPEIKLPEYRGVNVLQGGGAVMSIGYNEAIDEIKRLNGLGE